MTCDELNRLDELRAKSKLTSQERAEMKLLERKSKTIFSEQTTRLTNVFAVEPTTKISPLPIRFLSKERAGLVELSNDIKSKNKELIRAELGIEGFKDINETKLVRAAVYLLKECSHDEIIAAIKEVKNSMYS